MIHATTAERDYEVEQWREWSEDGWPSVTLELAAMANRVYAEPLSVVPDAHAWLTGAHEGWGGLWGELPGWLRDRMVRAAGDLVFNQPGAAQDASTALRDAVALIEEEVAWQ